MDQRASGVEEHGTETAHARDLGRPALRCAVDAASLVVTIAMLCLAFGPDLNTRKRRHPRSATAV
jgi:hypothetical protein